MGKYLKPGDLKAINPDQCWNTACDHYDEEHQSCCDIGLADEVECEDRYQLSDYGEILAHAAADHAVEWYETEQRANGSL